MHPEPQEDELLLDELLDEDEELHEQPYRYPGVQPDPQDDEEEDELLDDDDELLHEQPYKYPAVQPDPQDDEEDELPDDDELLEEELLLSHHSQQRREGRFVSSFSGEKPGCFLATTMDACEIAMMLSTRARHKARLLAMARMRR